MWRYNIFISVELEKNIVVIKQNNDLFFNFLKDFGVGGGTIKWCEFGQT